MEHLSLNYAGGTVRRERHDGRDYLVAPMTLIVSGVLNGSKGALYYPPEEIARNHDAWNGIPIVVNHPFDSIGRPVSARSPGTLEKFGIGHVYSATFRGKLIAEGWFDIEKTKKVDARVLNALKSGTRIELSTGLFTDNHPAPAGATFNGRAYDYVARNYRPDHLAILPDAKGACSLNDGCGVLVNQESHCTCTTCNDKKEKTRMPLTANQKKEIIDGLVGDGVWDESDRATLNKFADAKLLGLKKQSLALNCEMGPQGPEGDGDAHAKGASGEAADGGDAEEGESVPAPAAKKKAVPVENKKMTAADWYEMAPAEVKEVINDAVAVRNQRKEKIVQRLVANVDESKRAAKVKKLNEMSLNQLEELSELIPAAPKYSASNPFARRQADYTGAAGGATHNRETTNNAADDDDDILPLPTVNWAEAAKATA